jgi:phosphatidate phosphatase APP1
MRKRFIKWLGLSDAIQVKVYEGFGHEHNMMVWGHVLSLGSLPRKRYHKSILRNASQLIRLFIVKPVGGAKLAMQWGNQIIHAVSETDGFFRLEWQSDESVPAGLHEVIVQCVDDHNTALAEGRGSVFVPHITQLGIISDIDDTFLVSHSATIFKRLWTLLTLNAQSRKSFEGVAEHYRLLEYAQTDPATPNPFFYVSSSEWNLYEYLTEFVRYQKLPDGIFLLSQLKRWYQLIISGKTKHAGKFVRIVRIMEAFPNQRFVLVGDNSQKDPAIYRSMAEHYPHRVKAVYIRRVVKHNNDNVEQLKQVLDRLHIPFCFFEHSKTALEHSKSIGLGPVGDNETIADPSAGPPAKKSISGEQA